MAKANPGNVGAPLARWGDPDRISSRPERSLSLRQREKIQEMLSRPMIRTPLPIRTSAFP